MPLWVRAGLGGVIQGSCMAGSGAPQPAEAVLGTGVCSSCWRPPLAWQHWGRRAAAAVPWGCSLGCSCLLLLLCPQGHQFSSGKSFPPVCDYGRTAQPQPCRSADTRGGVPVGSQARCGPLGWILPLPTSTVASAKLQLNCACHQRYRCR